MLAANSAAWETMRRGRAIRRLRHFEVRQYAAPPKRPSTEKRPAALLLRIYRGKQPGRVRSQKAGRYRMRRSSGISASLCRRTQRFRWAADTAKRACTVMPQCRHKFALEGGSGKPSISTVWIKTSEPASGGNKTHYRRASVCAKSRRFGR